AKLIKSKGFEALRSLTKLHFANTEKALKIAKK
ncbi:ribonuclease HIII, partial [Gottfriedia acidiceleris]